MIELNKDGLAASEGWMQHQSATFGLHWKNAKPIIEAYFDTIHESDAPALALAILEAAGVKPVGYPGNSTITLGSVVGDLALVIAEQERATVEARERAELEAEALELFNTQVRVLGDGLEAGSLDDMHHIAKESWLAVARRAREMRAEK